MGYCIYITRRTALGETAAEPISLEAWRRLVADDPELVPRINDSSLILWTGLSSQRDPWFEWTDGQVWTQNPDTAQLLKVHALAKLLDAKVFDEEGVELVEPSEDNTVIPTYDYDFQAARDVAHRNSFPGVPGFVLFHSVAVVATLGLRIGRSTALSQASRQPREAPQPCSAPQVGEGARP